MCACDVYVSVYVHACVYVYSVCNSMHPLPPRLWVHEVFRVYYDRLVDDQDRTWLFTLLKDVVKSHFKEDFNGVFKHLASSGKVKLNKHFCVFVHHML